LPEEELQSQIYPNPNEGTFFVPANYKVLDVISVSGRRIGFVTEDHGENQLVRLTTTSAGMYIIRLSSSGSVFSSKIVIE
jgi:hypothetical protein